MTRQIVANLNRPALTAPACNSAEPNFDADEPLSLHPLADSKTFSESQRYCSADCG